MSKEDKPAAPRARSEDDATSAGERIAKRLARAGVASRRDAEAMIAEGRVKVNGRVLTTPALNVTETDRIEIEEEPIPEIERTRLFLFHKPAGVVTTNRDPEGRRTVFDILPPGTPRLMTVGRLDIATEGLLLLTNDGGLARQLELPTTGWLRRYRVRVHGKVDETALAGLKDGIAVDGVYYGAIEAALDRVQGSNAWLTIGLREGKNREVRNILGALGLDVNRLIRVSYGPFQLGELEERELREIKGRTLRDQLGERLIAAAGADFDAPVVNEFSNKPVKAERKAPEVAVDTRPINRKREREERREDALGRLSTKPVRAGGPKRDAYPARDGGAPRGKSGGGKPAPAAKREIAPPRSRAANVWMAPGARPKGPEAKARDAERAARYEAEGMEPRRSPRSSDRPGDRNADARPRGPGKPGGKPSFGKGPAGRGGPRGGSDGPPRDRPEGGRKAPYTGPKRSSDGPPRDRPEGGRKAPYTGPKRTGDGPPRGGPRGGPAGGPKGGPGGPKSGGPKGGGGKPGPRGGNAGKPGRGPGNADRRR
jgi:23S rRNA pseudouridine2605 synthase